MKKAIVIASLLAASNVAAPVFADETQAQGQPMTREQAQIAMDKMKADKKFITSQTLQLTDAEAKDFWPLYDEYQASLTKLNQRIQGSINEYADLYRNNTMTDDKALKLTNDYLAIESDETAMKQAFIPKLQKVLPGIKVARYMQIENKLRALAKFDLADKIPFVK